MAGDYILEFRDIGKDYYGNQVLRGINLGIRPGEIHALVGENGAGKSTLMNILFGMPGIQATGGHQGEILYNGEKISLKSPFEAMQMGIGMVHQEFMLLPNFTITENIKLNREIPVDSMVNKLIGRIFGQKLKTLDFDTMNKDARRALDTLDLGISELALIAGLPVGYKQFTEIAREIDKANIKLVVFDEPTAVLTETEAENLLRAMRRISDKGIAIIFITHRLDEVMEVSDKITILRDGQLVATKEKTETNVYEIAELMVGRKIEKLTRLRTARTDETIMSIKDLRVEMPGESLHGLDLDVCRGEILGIGGLAGQGKIGVANGVMGLYPAKGQVLIDGKPLALNNPKKSLARGLAFVSEDRRGVGLLLDSSIELNIVVTAMQNRNQFIWRAGPFSQIASGKIRRHALKMIADLDIRCLGPGQPVRRLSGGNQQKVCIARALTLDPGILFVSEPTRGIDVGAKKLVMETLVRLNEELGMTIIMTSSELAELRSVCDRIAIVSEGKIQGILSPDDSDVNFGLMMAGKPGVKGA